MKEKDLTNELGWSPAKARFEAPQKLYVICERFEALEIDYFVAYTEQEAEEIANSEALAGWATSIVTKLPKTKKTLHQIF